MSHCLSGSKCKHGYAAEKAKVDWKNSCEGRYGDICWLTAVIVGLTSNSKIIVGDIYWLTTVIVGLTIYII